MDRARPPTDSGGPRRAETTRRVEATWAVLCPDTTKQLLRMVRRKVRRIQRNPRLVRSFFDQTPLAPV